MGSEFTQLDHFPQHGHHHRSAEETKNSVTDWRLF